MKLITLNTKNTTYQMGVNEAGFLLHLYYGPKITSDMSNVLVYYERGMSGVPYDYKGDNTFSCDVLPMEVPCWGNGDYRSPAISVRTGEGISALDLRYISYDKKHGKERIPGLPSAYAEEPIETHEILLTDKALGINVILRYSIFYEADVITKNMIVKNNSADVLYLEKCLTSTLDFMDGEYDYIHFYGRHMMERITERAAVKHEKHCIESRRGISGHQQNPFVILADKLTTENAGLCYGLSFMYSGNFLIEIEKDQFDQTRIQMGISDERFDYELKQGETFYTPEVILSCAENGLNRLSQQFHGFIKQNVCRGKYKNEYRPVLINNWEATYFDFTGEKIIKIAEQARELGIEMLVLDDGWYGKRNNDSTGLGDWKVNEEKLGCTLNELVKKINQMGMRFGIWIEPEMINENSDLYRKHPEYVFKIPGRNPVLGRNQLVLDFSRKEVVDSIFQQISEVLDSANIEYVKMDMNRCIQDVCSASDGRQNYGTVLYRYVCGVYDFLERLTEKYPDILIEGCSSGGGRFDAGMLYYTPQIWCSDNTDPIERFAIQKGTSYGYPISAVSAHVSASPNHQTGRKTDLFLRGLVAMSGNLGYELDLTQLDEAEKDEIRKQIHTYKAQWDLIHNGVYYRGEESRDSKGYFSWNFVSKDQSQALLNVIDTAAHANRPVFYAKCYGMADEEVYYCQETGKEYSGKALKYVGIPVPIECAEYGAWQFHFMKIKRKKSS